MNKEDVDFLISIQDLEQPDFDNACLKRENTRLQQELQRKDNNWNELKNELEQEIATVSTNRVVDYNNSEWWYKLNCYGNILDKIKELEERK